MEIPHQRRQIRAMEGKEGRLTPTVFGGTEKKSERVSLKLEVTLADHRA